MAIVEVIKIEWFKKGYQPPRFETINVNLDDINYVFNESGVSIFWARHLSMCPNVVDGLGNIVFYDPEPNTTCCQEMWRKSGIGDCIRVDFYLLEPQSWHTL